MIDDIKNGKQVNLSNWTFCIPGVLHKQFQQPLVRRDFAFTITVSCFLIHRKDSCEQKHLITTKPGMFLTSCSSYIAKKRSLATQNWIFTIQKESHEEAFNLKKKKKHPPVADFLPVCCAASTSMTVLVLPSGPKVQTSFCTATLLVGGRRPLGD